jgi:hypothetical protein
MQIGLHGTSPWNIGPFEAPGVITGRHSVQHHFGQGVVL